MLNNIGQENVFLMIRIVGHDDATADQRLVASVLGSAADTMLAA